MVNEIPSLYPDVEERVTPPGKGQHGYYRRLRDGWIMTAGAWPSMRNDMSFKGCEFLSQFGLFTYGTPWGITNQKDRSGREYNALAEPWRMIFQHPDGAAQFPVEQVIGYRWHLRKPYREVEFPQLEGIEIIDLFCPECDKGVFSSLRQQESVDMLRTHLTSRFDELHSYRPEDLRALGQEIGVDFFAPRQGRRSVRRDPASLAAEEPGPSLNVTGNEAFTCPDCGEEFAHGGALGSHRRRHKQAAPA